ncbi:hypothetical protein AAVH_34760 [Aphelenchoides avenae]|nr:hypothetical protein AAVH_34760 [Aphelenchus avenae]
MPELDKTFPTAWPYGVLKTIHWVGPLAVLITIYLGPFIYSSVGFVLFSAWNAFVIALISWLAHIFGLQRRTFHFGNGYVYIPWTVIDFIVSLVFLVFFTVSTLICLIAMFDGLRYKATVVITYLFATIFCLISCAAFGYFAILVKRGLPNGIWRNLVTLVVEGDRLTVRPDIETSQAGPGQPAAMSTRQTYPGY